MSKFSKLAQTATQRLRAAADCVRHCDRRCAEHFALAVVHAAHAADAASRGHWLEAAGAGAAAAIYVVLGRHR